MSQDEIAPELRRIVNETLSSARLEGLDEDGQRSRVISAIRSLRPYLDDTAIWQLVVWLRD